MGPLHCPFRSLPLGVFIPLVTAGLLAGDLASAQSVTLDEGSFRILVEGREVGTESFAIRRSGSGPEAQTIATGDVRMTLPEGRMELRPALQASGEVMAVSAYQMKISGHLQEEIYVTRANARFRAQVRTDRGEQEREYRAAENTLFLDAGVAHHYFFLARARAGQGGRAPVIVPREGRQYTVTVTVVGDESVQIGGSRASARRLRLEGNGPVRHLWVDQEGRVLRVEHGDQSYVAVRKELP